MFNGNKGQFLCSSRTPQIPRFFSMTRDFYTHSDVVQISRCLLGKYLMTRFEGVLTGGIIVETEAYCGATDAACHAFPNRYTERTRTMYAQGGRAYIYLCYGIHRLFNIVTNTEGKADAVLIRAIEPTHGINAMYDRRRLNQPSRTARPNYRLTAGPGCVAQALGIGLEHNAYDLLPNADPPNPIWIDYAPDLPDHQIVTSTRIGVEGAGAPCLGGFMCAITSG